MTSSKMFAESAWSGAGSAVACCSGAVGAVVFPHPLMLCGDVTIK